MEIKEELPCPTKIQFTSRAKQVVGAVFADLVVRSEGEILFYLGRARVAVLNEQNLLIGTRKIARSSLDPENPFRCDSLDSKD
jgi:hypothetical protein